MAFDFANLAAPQTRLIGVLPSDADIYAFRDCSFTNFTAKDVQILRDLKMRPYMDQNPELLKQVDYLAQTGQKLELQSLGEIGATFLANHYIPNKIAAGEFI